MMSLHARRHRALFLLSVSFIAVMVVLLPRAADADLIQYSFAGTVDFIWSGVTSPSVSLGDSWSATFFIDAATPDASTASPLLGEYLGVIGSLSFGPSFGPHTLTEAGTSATRVILFPGAERMVIAFGYSPAISLDGVEVGLMILELDALVADVFGSDALAETVGLSLSDFDEFKQVRIIAGSNADAYRLGITSASSQIVPTAVPELRSIALLLFASPALMFMRRLVGRSGPR